MQVLFLLCRIYTVGKLENIGGEIHTTVPRNNGVL